MSNGVKIIYKKKNVVRYLIFFSLHRKSLNLKYVFGINVLFLIQWFIFINAYGFYMLR